MGKMTSSFKRKIAKIKVGIASPERIREWSSGEVKKPETINHRTFKPERDGLFCEKIFGPVKDYECTCGRYKGKKYEGTVCERCGVKVESKESRRRKMGHIELAAPVVHIWFLKSSPSILSILLNIPVKELENIIYYGSKRVVEKIWLITDPKDSDMFDYGDMLHNTEYEIFKEKMDFEVEQAVKVLHVKEKPISKRSGVVSIESEMTQAKHEVTWIKIKDDNGVEEKWPIFEGSTLFVEDGDEIEEGTQLADTFLYEEEILTASEYLIFEQFYPSAIEIERDIERDTPILVITDIDPEVEKEIGKGIGNTLLQEEYEAYKELYNDKITADYGGEAIKKLLKNIDLHELKIQLEAELAKLDKKSAKALKLIKRLKVVKDFLKSANKPEWMIIEALPVVPPDIRPLIQIDGGRFAATDLNDLYRRVINRNNRLQKLFEIEAPEIIIRNEKRILQQAVDSLIYNGRVGKAMTDRSGRPLRSLTDLIKGKKGRFRRNLLGKRVDYSGRAVIIVGPELKIHECGLPKKMAMELFKPFVLNKLLKDSNASSKNARKLKKTIIEKEMPEAWEMLEEVIKGHPVMLNRAPTLHRISIQAFIPRLIEGNSIQLHPLVCPPFNADFDGDQMAVHVPLSNIAQAEAKFLMLSRYNIISPANGKPISMPGKDMIAGAYYLTTVDPKYFESKKLPKNIKDLETKKSIKYIFGDEFQAFYVHEYEKITKHEILVENNKLKWNKPTLNLHEPIGLYYKDKLIKTTVGRLIFKEILPEPIGRFNPDFNKIYKKKEIKNLIFDTFKYHGIDRTADLLDDIKFLGFHYATVSGLTISVRDIVEPKERLEIIKESEKTVMEIEKYFEEGYLTDEQRYKEVVKVWEKTISAVTEVTSKEFKKYPFNPVWMMVDSGARGNIDQLKQLAGMRGLMADPSGKVIELPIKSNFRNGLSELEFFISTHGARKGSADTALRTSTAGYLTRRLVDVAQSITVTEPDCGTEKGIEARELIADGLRIEKLADYLFGRVLASDVLDPQTDEIIINPETGKKYVRDVMLDEEDAEFLANYKTKIPVVEIKENINIDDINLYLYNILNNDVLIDGELLFSEGTEIDKDIILSLKQHNVKTVNIKEYKAVNFVFVGDNLKVEDENGKLITLTNYQEKIDADTAKKLERYNVEEVEVRPSIYVRSILTCESEHGVCAKCYGMDLSNHKIVNIGESVGIIAAQSIGEPGTQLTMRTFHTGGIATTGDITQGLPRAEELFEARKNLKGPEAEFSTVKGIVRKIDRDEKGKLIFIVEDFTGELHTYIADPKVKPTVSEGDKVEPGYRLTSGNIKPRRLLEELGAEVTFDYLLKEIKKIYAEQGVEIHDKHFEIIIKQMFNKVEITYAGDTDFMPRDLVNIKAVEKVNKKIYEENKMIEQNREDVIGKKLAEKISIKLDETPEIIGNIGDEVTEELLNKIIDVGIKEIEVFKTEPQLLETDDGEIRLVGEKKVYLINAKEPARFERKLLRITKSSLEREGWLGAASFQQTVQVLTEAALEGKEDYLLGLKENVIVGQPIPAGTGLKAFLESEISIFELPTFPTEDSESEESAAS
ncbi:DNA-directed RNA polymerase subunit beta' [Marinitoga hydrogenitolerans DSM 16785]|uniref:DNA-directed RNA polymerase subunit beta' n=1 Tax=Marinitoga hydrogenitolerans (strain DSM 16785 / JCM 12826 / AT1271) TaxID=1122195 RepID=A0A1M4S7C9_MARH1|nr:DNA-directed RNA polymerase subunit beta' [Marinitoga hydrogenitolerans]SHE28113.1 DNA-directed RNA polymerase subunit beta' [Marinitoga hydrogenitolerans DSM 16785]